MFEITPEVYIGLSYDVGDDTIDHSFTEELYYVNRDQMYDDYMPDIIFIEHNPDVFVRLK